MSAAPDVALSHWEGEPVPVWEELWGVPRVEAWHSLESTNSHARELAEGGAAPWTVVVADVQTSGRGREGRAWLSEEGRGLWFSLIAPNRESASGLAALRAGVAIAAVLRALGGTQSLGLKWPNDLWWQDRKLGGILCERSRAGTVIGVGINLRAPSDRSFRVPPVGLEEVVDGCVARGPLLGSLIAGIRIAHGRGGARLSASELERFDRYDCLRDRAVRCEPGPGGIARGVGPDGGLRIETGKGVRTVHAGTVRPVGPVTRRTADTADEELS